MNFLDVKVISENKFDIIITSPEAKKFNNFHLCRKVFGGKKNYLGWKFEAQEVEVTKEYNPFQNQVTLHLDFKNKPENMEKLEHLLREIEVERLRIMPREEKKVYEKKPSQKFKLALDAYYGNGVAKIVGMTFKNLYDEIPYSICSLECEISDSYIPGQFYKRELPPIQKLITEKIGLENLRENYDMIIVDGLYDLWDGKPGLGHRLRDWLGLDIEVVGIAKSKIRDSDKFTVEVLRGENTSHPLYVNGSNMNRDFQEMLEIMAGDYRIPLLLKQLDILTRK